MKIIQSFWSADRDITKDPAGWISPQHHLMAWALSCLKLREHYDNVELYTDQTGYDWLIGKLQLPYTKVHVVMDELNTYKKELWALAKVKAYSLQDTPFLHVDGDVFIWKPFPPALLEAPLITQNTELATGYYAHKFRPIIAELNYLPEAFDLRTSPTDIGSCNAGIMGGTDHAFYKNYCQLAFDMVDKNDLRKLSDQTLIDFNIVFEQVLFCHLAAREKKQIHGLLEKEYTDNGYLYDEIGDFTTLPYTTGYIHLLGQHKRNAMACNLMARFLLAEYPEYFFRIKELFSTIVLPDMQTVIDTPVFKKAAPVSEEMVWPEIIADISDFNILLNTLDKDVLQREKIVLLQRDYAGLHSNRFFLQPDHAVMIERDPLLKIAGLSQEVGSFLFEETAREYALIEDSFQVTILPDVVEGRYKASLLEPLDYVILASLEEKITFGALLEAVATAFSGSEVNAAFSDYHSLVLSALKKLNVNKCVHIHYQ